MKEIPRSAGILLACSSLPSPYGIGTFGSAAYDWLRFLRDAGQKYWQILPLGVTGWGDSPYQSFSAFAMSPYYIDLDMLVRGGLLKSDELKKPWGRSSGRVDYAALYHHRTAVLRKALERFDRAGSLAQVLGGADGSRMDTVPSAMPDFETFCAQNAFWLEDWSLFMALKTQYKGRAWIEWDEAFRLRDAKALRQFKEKFQPFLDYVCFEQFCASTQWQALKAQAAAYHISIIGDMPIYVALDSADVWSTPELFELDNSLKPVRVAGCPPDPFAAEGQLWGNPLYRWERHQADGFAWWISRLKENFKLYDVLRIDHFRGLESYYAIDAKEKNARHGTWIKGPGASFIDAVRGALPYAAVIAEDLGYLSPEVKALLDYSGYPGMKILQFAFDSRESGDYMPYTYEKNCIVYTGTHDNPTTASWFKTAKPEDVRQALRYFGITTIRNGVWAFIRTALASTACLAVIPMQDYLRLGADARMNTPSRLGNNWQWRLKNGAANDSLAQTIRAMCECYGRVS